MDVAREVYPYPGDTIVVPRDIGVGGIALVSVATKIISDIAFSAACLMRFKTNFGKYFFISLF